MFVNLCVVADYGLLAYVCEIAYIDLAADF